MNPLRHSVVVRAAETTAESSAARMITGPYPPLTQQGKSLIAVSVIMVFFTTAWTVMRIISRNIRKSQYYIEDYFYFVGQVRGEWPTTRHYSNNVSDPVLRSGRPIHP